jgi:hypothetical protein
VGKPLSLRLIASGILFAAFGLSGCGGVSTNGPAASPSETIVPVYDSNAGLNACQSWSSARAGAYQLEAEYDSTAGTVAAWEERLAGDGFSSQWRNYPGFMAVTVCYFRGQLGLSGPPPPSPATPPPAPDRGVILIGANGFVADGPRHGYHTTTPLERPSG